MFYVIGIDTPINMMFSSTLMKTHNFDDAKQYADQRKAETGENYSIIKVETAWCTQTMAELMKKRKAV